MHAGCNRATFELDLARVYPAVQTILHFGAQRVTNLTRVHICAAPGAERTSYEPHGKAAGGRRIEGGRWGGYD